MTHAWRIPCQPRWAWQAPLAGTGPKGELMSAVGALGLPRERSGCRAQGQGILGSVSHAGYGQAVWEQTAVSKGH